ncbi:MAG TPA: Wzz/FepE/Etk N-terminal domain-containing protein [Ktedonobacterales bacterium]|nr:Wzz/FepE/Etk N-terminal domain-containing protein [Ktedonobacterales bacterium]
MGTEYYRSLLLKHWRLIIICIVLTGIGAGIGSFLAHSKYESTATIQLVSYSSDTSSVAAASQTLQTEAKLATSNSILEQVTAHYPGLTIPQLYSEIAASVPSSTQLIEITVTDEDGTRAAHLANDLAAALIAQQKQAMQQLNAQAQQPLLDSLAATQKQIDTDQATLKTLQANPSANQQQIQQLESDLSGLQQQHAQELQTLTTIQSEEAGTSSFLQVVGVAQPSHIPLHTTSWHAAVAAAGLGLGLLLGILLVLLRDWLDQQVPTTSALSELLGWPILEELDMPSPKKGQPASSAGQEGTQPEAPYHLLGQNLAFLGIESPLVSLAVTSTLADSKAANAVAAGLAASLARGGKRVVLVDANFSKPSQHRRFGTPSEPGLGAVALAFSASPQAELSLAAYLYPARDESSFLRVLPAGPIPPNPKQVLKSQAMGEVFQALRKTEADAVVLAAPPVNGSEENCVIPALADGVLVVIGRSHARRAQLLRMKRSLEEAGAKILGCVLWSNGANQLQPVGQPGDVVEVPLP